MRIITSSLLPKIDVEYDYLWPVIGGHIWVKGKSFEYGVYMIAGDIVVHPSMEKEFMDSFNKTEVVIND
jgi:formylmethanofuran dehydrogenase subunit C